MPKVLADDGIRKGGGRQCSARAHSGGGGGAVLASEHAMPGREEKNKAQELKEEKVRTGACKRQSFL